MDFRRNSLCLKISGTLFVIAIELLAKSIRRSKEIKGIPIDGDNEVKLAQYADDTTVLLSDVQSVLKLLDLLSLFERCSGLKLCHTKSEMIGLALRTTEKISYLNFN